MWQQVSYPCRKTGEQWFGFEATFDDCRVVLEPSTKNTFMMVVSVDPRVGEHSTVLPYCSRTHRWAETGMLSLNLHNMQPHLAEFAGRTSLDRKCGLCRHNTELKYDVKGDDDPNVPAWDDILSGIDD